MKRLLRAALLALMCALAGCASYEAGSANRLIRASYDSTDTLIGLMPTPLPKDAPLLVATLVNIDALTESSTLGRILSEQVSARLTQQGYQVIELKMRGSVFVKASQGELMLSREIKDLSQSHQAQAVVVGTYALGPQHLFVNLKILRPQDNRVLSAHDVAIKLDSTVRMMLMSET